MWPFRKPLPKRIARDLTIVTDGMREIRGNIQSALQEGLSHSNNRQRQISRLIFQVAAANDRLMRDIDSLVGDLNALRSKPIRQFGFSDRVLQNVLIGVVSDLADPIGLYLREIELVSSMPPVPGEESAPIVDKRLERNLKVLLDLGQELTRLKSLASS